MLTKELYEENYNDLYMVAFRMLNKDAQEAKDVVHDTFVRALKIDLDPGQRPITALMVALKRACIDRWRACVRHRQLVDDLVYTTGFEEDQYDLAHIEALVLSAVSKLHKQQQQIFNMRYYTALSYADMHTLTGISIQHLRNQFTNAWHAVCDIVKQADMTGVLHKLDRRGHGSGGRPKALLLDKLTGNTIAGCSAAARMINCTPQTLWYRIQHGLDARFQLIPK